MKYRFTSLAPFLLLGAIVNVVVTWACVWCAWPPNGEIIDETRDLRLDIVRGWPTEAFDQAWIASFGWQARSSTMQYDFEVTKHEQRSFGYCRVEYSEEGAHPPRNISTGRGPDDVAIVAVTRAGFPLSSVMAERWSDFTKPPIATRYFFTVTDFLSWPRQPQELVGGFTVNRALPHWGATYTVKQVYPMAPLWLGFAVNTLFYAVILWLLHAAPILLRRRRRAKRGLCPACAYPVGTSSICSECGGAI